MVDRNNKIEDIVPSITINDDAVMPHEPTSIIGRFFDGAVSGFVSGAVLQPLQVIKTSMQVSPIDKPTDHKFQSKTL